MLAGGPGAPFDLNYPGNDLLSHAVTSAVPSALEGLTSVFWMGTGVAPPATSPGIAFDSRYGDSRVQPGVLDEVKRGQAARPISTGPLNAVSGLHLRRINLR